MNKKVIFIMLSLCLVCNISGCSYNQNNNENSIATESSNEVSQNFENTEQSSINTDTSYEESKENTSKEIFDEIPAESSTETSKQESSALQKDDVHYTANDEKISEVKSTINDFSIFTDDEMKEFEEQFKEQYNTDFSKNDSDNDGICDGYEIIFGTDKDKSDTDGDGIDDLTEMVFSLDPTKSNENMDTDSDGINDIDEIKIGTEPYDEDTDNDGLNDYDEIYKYGTNPTEQDTDNDGLSDYEEISLGLNPLKNDTDNDGITDDKEKISQTYTIDISGQNINDGNVKQVSLSAEMCGSIKGNCTLSNTYNIDILSSEVVSLVGVPVKAEIDTDYSNAKIEFKIDKEYVDEDYFYNLRILCQHGDGDDQWYYTQKTNYDFENGIISTTFTTDGTYLLVDYEDWKNVWGGEV